MPASAFTKVVGSTFRAIDSDAAVDGAPVSSLLLRQMASNSNRILGLPQLMFNLVWDSGWTDDELDTGLIRPTAMAGYATSKQWSRVLGPIRVPKKSVTKTMQVELFAHFSETTYIQWTTSAVPFLNARTSVESPNVQECPPVDENWTHYIKAGIPLGGGDFETISAYLRANPSADAINTALYGTPSGGFYDIAYPGSFFISASTTWVAVGTDPAVFSIADGSCYLAFVDSGGVLLVPPRRITGLGFPSGGGQEVYFEPGLSSTESSLVNGYKAFEIRKWGDWRLASATAYSEAIT